MKELDWWAGPGGDDYMIRNGISERNIAQRQASLEKLLRLDPWNLVSVSSVLEVGCGPGANLVALQRILPEARLVGIEPNPSARESAAKVCPTATIIEGHAGEIGAADDSFDLVFTAGVLIHVHPDRLAATCREIARVSRAYVLAIEYFAPSVEPVVYHGDVRIWRNDFGKVYRDEVGLVPIRHGFFWREADEGYDSTVWWLLKKGS